MITGFNTDVEYDGKIFHVQTEERGRGNPVVETLVYCGGELVTFVTTSYADLAKSTGYSEGEVLGRMEGQHERLIRQILGGKFHPAPKPYGHDLISNRSLDEVVREYLDDSRILLDEVQQFLDEREIVEDEEGLEGETAATSRARKLRRILARLESRMEEVRSTEPPSVSVAEPAPEQSDEVGPVELERNAVHEKASGAAVAEAVPAAVVEAALPRSGLALVLRARSWIWVGAAVVYTLAFAALLLLLPTLRTGSPPPVLQPRSDAATALMAELLVPARPVTGVEPDGSFGDAAQWPFLPDAEPPDPGTETTGGERSESTDTANIESGPRASPAPRPGPEPRPSSPRATTRRQPVVEGENGPLVRIGSPPADRRTASREPSAPQRPPDPSAPTPESTVGTPEAGVAGVAQLPRDERASSSAAPPVVDPSTRESTPEVPSVWTGKLVDYAEVDVPPRPLRQDLPSYTRRARRQQRQGTVEIAVMVIENGKVAHAKLVQGIPDSDLSQAALDAALGWEYEPARKDGFAVRVWKTARIRFSLSSDRKAIVKIDE